MQTFLMKVNGMKYLIYLVIAALVVWAVAYLTRHIRRQMKGDCGSCSSSGSCSGCPGSCGAAPQEK